MKHGPYVPQPAPREHAEPDDDTDEFEVIVEDETPVPRSGKRRLLPIEKL